MLISVVRHAESLGNAGMLTEDDPDPLLSPRGIEQARRTAERLAKEGVTHIWSSPFRRAIQTASCLADLCGVEVLLEPGMVEHYIYDDLRTYRGRAGEELTREFEWLRLPEGFRDYAWTPSWGESWDELKRRTRRVAEKALALAQDSAGAEGEHLVVFGHGASSKALLIALTGQEIAPDAGFVNAGLSRVRLDSTLPGETIFLNDASHLSGLEQPS